LLAFALTHCEDDSLEVIIQALLRLEQTNLHRSLQLRAEVPTGRNGVVEIDEDGVEIYEDTFEDFRYR
jgi:hypothetical protein